MIKAKRELLNPPGWPLLLAGGLSGLLAGAFSFSESPENATDIGIALFVGISLGGWLGATAIRLLNSFFVRVYRDSDAKLLKAREELSRYFADVLPAQTPDNQLGSMAAQRSREAMTNFSTSLTFFRALAHMSIYLYPIAGVVTFAEITTLGLLAAGGLEIPTTISVLSSIGRVVFLGLFVIYLLTIVSGLILIKNTQRLFAKISSFEELLAARRDGDIGKLAPDISTIEKAVSVPPKVLSRLAA